MTGIGILLGIVFLVLRLTDVIDWNYFLVLLPFWGGFVIDVLVTFVIASVGLHIAKNI